ncbi:Uncharacterized protein BP5553_09233 [Venustampulla echinocandica]|uniref:Antigenic cell wall galactomannoprotein n=1 Tax=Venustampulla echinocandica TaxID=2656787 RepID=A0A370TC57_9HELO|nr:Uncharacterized protein BP5553_09233 [Venustampulla echinocandica]RDL31831.1 Uncharacterized protein BP5553_09233 [Venustampulla echinocandica]
MRLQILGLTLLTTTVLADGASILAAMSKISSSTAKLNNTVTDFSAGLLGLADVVPLLIDSTNLLHDINSGTKVASSSANLTVPETIQVASATSSLVADVQTVLTSIVNAKPKFDKLVLVSPVVLVNLKEQKRATDKFSAAVVSKLPAAFVEVAKGLVAPIDTAFDAAIAEYKPF